MMKKSTLKQINCLLFLWLSINLSSIYAQQNTLANYIQYSDTSFTDLPGNGFLIDIGDEILAVTCKHALWLNRSKSMKSIDFDNKLKEWKMIVLNDPTQYVVVGDLINLNKNEKIGERNTDRDYLVFKVKENHSKIKPLKLSCKRVEAGDTLKQTGWAYRIKKSNAQVFKAVAKKYSGASLLMNSVIRQNNAGLSGSPITNRNNELVAIVSSWQVDNETNQWFEAPCSIDYLWQVLYEYWLFKHKKEKSIKSFQDYLLNYKSLNGTIPNISSYLYTELFFNDWLKLHNKKYGTNDDFIKWTDFMKKSYGINITSDNYRNSLLIFNTWKEKYLSGKMETKDLEHLLKASNVAIPAMIDFCEFSQELIALGLYDKAINMLLFADERIQHIGQLYAFLGDAYKAKGDKTAAKESYQKCLKTYPEYPQATEGLKNL